MRTNPVAPLNAQEKLLKRSGRPHAAVAVALLVALAAVAVLSSSASAGRMVRVDGNVIWTDFLFEGAERTLSAPIPTSWDTATMMPTLSTVQGSNGAMVPSLANIMCDSDGKTIPTNDQVDFCIRGSLTEDHRGQHIQFTGVAVLDGQAEGVATGCRLRSLENYRLPCETVTLTVTDASQTNSKFIQFTIFVYDATPRVVAAVAEGGEVVQEGGTAKFELRLNSPMRTDLAVNYYWNYSTDKGRIPTGYTFGFRTDTVEAYAWSKVIELPITTAPGDQGNSKLVMFAWPGNGYQESGKIVLITVTDATPSGVPPSFWIVPYPQHRAITEGQIALFLIKPGTISSEFDQTDLDVFVEDAADSDFIAPENEGRRWFKIGPSYSSPATLVIVQTTDDAIDEPDGEITVRLRLPDTTVDLWTATIHVSDND